MKSIFRLILLQFRIYLFDPVLLFFKVFAVPRFISNILIYRRVNTNPAFSINISKLYYSTYDKYFSSGITKGHYFFQDVWAARLIFKTNYGLHVDIGSRIDGFIAHLLPFCKVIYVDIRPLRLTIDNFIFVSGSIVNLPFQDDTLKSISCLHVLEHIGLGRYGDPVWPVAYKVAALELQRVLALGGRLYIGVPVGTEGLYYDAHRVFSPETIVELFPLLKLTQFDLINDAGDKIISDATFEEAKNNKYGCGLFIFQK